MLEEREQVALESDFGHDLPHLGVNTRDLGQADVVNLIGVELGGGVAFEGEVVVRVAVGQLPYTIVTGRDFLLPFQERDQCAIRRRDSVDERFVCLRDERVLVRLIDILERSELALEVGDECAVYTRVVVRCSLEDVAAVVDDHRKHERGRHDARLLALLKVFFQLSEKGTDTVQASDVGGGVGDCVDAMVVDEERWQSRLGAEHLIDGVVVESPLESVDCALGLMLEQAVADL